MRAPAAIRRTSPFAVLAAFVVVHPFALVGRAGRVDVRSRMLRSQVLVTAMPVDPGQTRPARIALDYFKQSDSLRRWKLILTVVAVAAALVWLLSGLLRSDGGRLRYSRGPVASVHAMWDAQCEVCH